MAGDFTNLTSREDIEFLGGNKTRNVISSGVLTVPHNVYFEFRVPRKGFTHADVVKLAEAYAANVEGAFTNPNIAGVEWTQRQTASGYLADEAIVTVQSDSGDSTATLTVPWGSLDLRALDPMVADLAGTLNAIEAS